ncbi:hypothetical protein [Flavobacterium sp.]|uniref:hypothetical protein n=1 Tax=Flavobacterium sp. TaxID=239 RepID=UPI00262BB2FA|nr:hypothetical protein [Flavobacterium sp.]
MNLPNLFKSALNCCVLFFTITGVGQELNRQNTFIDALKLTDIYNKLPNPIDNIRYDVTELTSNFRNVIQPYASDENLLKNPFFKDKLIGIYPKEDEYVKNNYVMGDSSAKNVRTLKVDYLEKKIDSQSASGGNWQAMIINGLSTFMAGRFKQEAFHVGIDRTFKKLREKDATQVKILFPRTVAHIELLYGEGENSYYTADLMLLQQTAQLDIEKLPENLVSNSDVLIPEIRNNPKLKDMLGLSAKLVEYSKNGASLDKLIRLLAVEDFAKDSNTKDLLRFADLIAQAMLNPSTSANLWVNFAEIPPPTTTNLKDIQVLYFYGLLYEQLNAIPSFRPYLELKVGENLSDLSQKIYKLLGFTSHLNEAYNYLKNKNFSLQKSEEVLYYIRNINSSYGQFSKVLSDNKIIDLPASTFDFTEKYLSITECLLNKDYKKAIPLLIVQFGSYMSADMKSLRTLGFVGQLATIESADEFEALLSAYSLPIGSSSIKRRSELNVSVNGYVGLTAGWETAYGTKENSTATNLGLAAPIGLSTTFAKGKITAFVSIIDLGSVVNQRLNNDNNTYSNLRLEQFFTPGIGLFYNFKNLPISAGMHFNYIPNLRKITYNDGVATVTETNRSVSRLNFSILMDIPFFTIYNKEKK